METTLLLSLSCVLLLLCICCIGISDFIKSKKKKYYHNEQKAPNHLWEVTETTISFPSGNQGEALKQLRKKANLSQKELAGMIGISRGYISKMETGKSKIPYYVAKRLAKCLSVSGNIFI